MADPDVQTLRDCVVLSIINAFGLFYFYLFTIHFLLFHFPSSPAEILVAMSVLVFCAGVIVWYFLSLVYRILHAFQANDAGNLQKLEFGGALILIWTATIPSAVLLLRNQPSLQLGYLSAFTIVAVGSLVDFLVWGSSIHTSRYIFPYNCVSLGLLSLIPSIHALTGTFESPPLIGDTLWPSRHVELPWRCLLPAPTIGEVRRGERLAAQPLRDAPSPGVQRSFLFEGHPAYGAWIYSLDFIWIISDKLYHTSIKGEFLHAWRPE
ncbi:Hly-III-related protein [Penicillium brevicompactum]|uniref:Hly-III-related protein n=1 Tax=Penicillium brevicompactum TaxID=5074 RepID=A0A9W9QP34_PENBR|nr:Hly-III-related protein [Penicillium brevicompactum]